MFLPKFIKYLRISLKKVNFTLKTAHSHVRVVLKIFLKALLTLLRQKACDATVSPHSELKSTNFSAVVVYLTVEVCSLGKCYNEILKSVPIFK